MPEQTLTHSDDSDDSDDLTEAQWSILMVVLSFLLTLGICGAALVAEGNGVW